jgi:hypothetical protein
MIAITNVEVQNLIYVAGAVLLIIVLSIIVALWHRKPKSVESNMASFNRGLRALAPGAEPVRRKSGPAGRKKGPVPPVVESQLPPRTNTVHTIRPVPVSEPATPAEETQGETGQDQPAGSAGEESSKGSEPRAVHTETTNDTPTTLEAETG